MRAGPGADCPSHWTADKLLERTQTDPKNGLTLAQAVKRLAEDGPNELKRAPRPSFLRLFAAQFGVIVITLLIASLWATSYKTCLAIFVIVFLNAGIAAYAENQAGGALEALAKMSQPSIRVIRDGWEQVVATTTLVYGDVVVIETGDVVPADIRLIETMDLNVSELRLTGEPDDVSKSAKVKPRSDDGGDSEKLTPENMCFSGCSCTSGKGRGVVVATGMQTRIGRLTDAELTGSGHSQTKKRFGCLPKSSANQTPLQHSVGKLGAQIGFGVHMVCLAVFIIGWIRDTRDLESPSNHSWTYMILIFHTLIVVAVPEGIPLCVTISLSIGSSSMVKQNVRVRKLAAVATLGSASVICSDKTGTLTEGKMTMVHMWSGGIKYDISGKGFDPTVGTITRSGCFSKTSEELGVRSSLLAALLCCNTTLRMVKDPETGVEKWEPKGNSSEAPIVVAARKVGFSTDDLSRSYPRVLEVPFSSSRKMMLTVTDVSGRSSLCPGGLLLPPGTSHLSVCKGAPDYVLDICHEFINANGRVEPLEASMKADIMTVVDGYSSQALRVMAIALRPMASLPFDPADEDITVETKFEHCSRDLQLVGLVASIDLERDGVKESVAVAHGASIKVVMITGDYLQTAIAVAKSVGILEETETDDGGAAVDCGSLRPGGAYLSEAEIDAITAEVKCFARAKPEDKIEIVKSFKRQGLVSAVTGDSVNDAPALHQADIGMAMGIQGTQVARGAADMILTDDNFCSIVAAVEKCRAIYAGIQKFVAFIVSVHMAEVLQIFFCVITNIPVMRTPLQILLLILVTDLPPSIALGMEPGEPSILRMRPRSKKEPIMLGWMWQSCIVNGAILTAVIIGVYIIALVHYCDGAIFQNDIMFQEDFKPKLANARTVAFISLVFSENARAYISRSFDQPVYRNFFGNKEMHKAIGASQVALYVAVLVPFLSDQILGLRGVDIGIWGWGVSLLGPLGTVVLCELYKIVTHRHIVQYQEKLRIEAEAEMERHRQLVAEQVAAKNNGYLDDIEVDFYPKGSGKCSNRAEPGKPASWARAFCCLFSNAGRIP